MHTHPDRRTVAVVLPPREGFSPDAVGAVGLLVHRLARAAPGPFRPVVIGPPPGAAPFTDVAFVPAEPAWVLAPGNLRYAAGVARRVRSLGPALIEVHNRPEVALALARRFPAIPVSLFLHNDPQGMRNARTAGERQALLRALARVVTVSSFLADRLLDGVSAPPPRAPAVLPNCLDLADLPSLAPAGERAKTILFAGRIVADKGADAFVSACARALPRLPGWRAEMIGADRFRTGSPETPFIRSLRPRADAAGIRLSGYRSHADVLAAMARAAIVAAPSRWPEPFGLTALEALACGAALLCSPRGGLREVAGDAAMFVDPDDSAGFADALVALAADPGCRAALSEAGRARAALFDVHPAAQALDALREEILSS